jgi:imidazolonepropionase-like amidohydrolase
MLRLTGGVVYDVESGGFQPATLVIEGDRIVDLTPPSSGTQEGEVVDASGLFLLPGLIDCHVHLTIRAEDADPAATARHADVDVAAYAADAAKRTVLGGITSVRDVGGWNYLEMTLRHEIEAGRRPGPRLFLAGRLLSMPTPAVAYYPGMYEVASGPAEVRAAVAKQLERGADVIKVMATGAMLSPEDEDAGAVQFGPDELRAAVEATGERGGRVAAHAHARDGMENAALAGVASIEHGTFADASVLRLMAERGTFLVPTMAASLSPLRDPEILGAMPSHVRNRFLSTRQTHVDAVRLAHQLGVAIAMGTDAGTPGNPHGENAMECVYLVEEVGMTPAASIRAATLNAARLLGREADLGTLEPGKAADIIGLRADPLQDVRELTRASLVMKGGAVVRGL